MRKTLGILTLGIMLGLSGMVRAEEPYDCINASDKSDEGYSKCYLAETKRLTEEITKKYNTIAANKLITSWNNGNGMFKGNLKDMFDSWVAYRNRFCSLTGIIGNNNNGESKTFHQSLCLYEMSKQENGRLSGMISDLTSQIINDGAEH